MIEEETIGSAENVEGAHVYPIKELNAKKHPHMDLGERKSGRDGNVSGSAAREGEAGSAPGMKSNNKINFALNALCDTGRTNKKQIRSETSDEERESRDQVYSLEFIKKIDLIKLMRKQVEVQNNNAHGGLLSPKAGSINGS